MTEENSKMREALRSIESVASACLASQPADDGACERHLARGMAKIAEISKGYLGLVEVEISDIEWDTDGEDVELPRSVRLMMNYSENVEDTLADRLSDEYGWCVRSCTWRKL